MLKGFIKPVGIIFSGILCIHLSAFAAGTDTTKSSEPAKKAAEVTPKKEAATPKQPEAAPKKEASAPKQKEATPSKQDDSKTILATVNGENITQQDVNQTLNKFAGQIPKEQIPAATKQILDGLINEKLIMQFIRNNKLEVSPADIEAELNKIREDIKSNPDMKDQTLEQVLEQHGGSIEDMKRDINISLSLEKYLSKDIDDKQVKEHFEQTKSEYSEEPTVKASHILIDTRKMKTKEEKDQAKDKIKKIKAEIDAGKDFAEAAKQYSDCPSKEKGGDLGFFQRKGQMVEPFAAAAFALKVGQVSDPVETNFGFHIIKVTEIKEAKEANFDDANVKQKVKQEMMKEKAQALMTQIKQDAKIDIKTAQ